MGIFSTIETAFVGMVNDIITSDNICKLLYYDNYNPLSQSVPATPSQMIYGGKNDMQEENYHRIFLMPKVPTVMDKKKTIIVPRVFISGRNNGSAFYSDVDIIFDIVTHNSLYTIIDNGIRVFKISEEINNLYCRQNKNYGLGKVILKGFSPISYNEKWQGYKLVFGFTDFTKNS